MTFFSQEGQHHIDAITEALLAKYVMKKSGSLSGMSEKGMVCASDGIDFLGARITRDDDGRVWCDQSNYILHCMRENKFINEDGQVVLKKAWGRRGHCQRKERPYGSVPEIYWSNDVADDPH